MATTNSPWLSSFSVGDIHSIAVSHGEGKFVVNEPLARELFENGQVAFQYVDAEGRVTAASPVQSQRIVLCDRGYREPRRADTR